MVKKFCLPTLPQPANGFEVFHGLSKEETLVRILYRAIILLMSNARQKGWAGRLVLGNAREKGWAGRLVLGTARETG
jgi:hypothetical protein